MKKLGLGDRVSWSDDGKHQRNLAVIWIYLQEGAPYVRLSCLETGEVFSVAGSFFENIN